MNNYPEKDPVLNSVEQMGRHREFVIENALMRIIQAVPEVEHAEVVTVPPTENNTERYPQNVVSMDMGRQQRQEQETEHADMLGYSRDVIDAIYEEKNAA